MNYQECKSYFLVDHLDFIFVMIDKIVGLKKKHHIQGFHLVQSKVIPFRERVDLTLGQNNWCHFFTDTDPFDGRLIK